jgi:hypothetical protein
MKTKPKKDKIMKIAKLIFCATIAFIILSGCMTLSASKAYIVTPQPGETKIVVKADAVVTCQDYFFFQRCTLNLEMQQVR